MCFDVKKALLEIEARDAAIPATQITKTLENSSRIRPYYQILTHTGRSAAFVVLGRQNTERGCMSLKSVLWDMCVFINQSHFLGASLPKYIPEKYGSYQGVNCRTYCMARQEDVDPLQTFASAMSNGGRADKVPFSI